MNWTPTVNIRDIVILIFVFKLINVLNNDNTSDITISLCNISTELL